MKTGWVIVIGVASFLAGAVTGVMSMKKLAEEVHREIEQLQAQVDTLDQKAA